MLHCVCFRFPSAQVLGLGQMITAIVIMRSLKMFGFVSFPDLSLDIYKKVRMYVELY